MSSESAPSSTLSPYSTAIAFLLLTSAQVIWSGNFIAGRMLAGVIEPFTLVTLRWAISMAIIFLLFHRTIIRQWPLVKERMHLLIPAGVVGTSIFPGCLYIGLKSSEALNATLLFSAAPVVVVVLSWLMFSERISARQSIGIMLGIAGATVVVMRGSFEALQNFSFREGDLWIFAGLTAWSAYCVLQPRIAGGLKQETLIFYCTLSGMPLSLLGLAYELTFFPLPQLDLKAILTIGYIALFPSLTAYFLWNYGQQRLGSSQASLFNNVPPISTAILSYIYLGEDLHSYHVIAAALIIGGVVLFSRRKKRSHHVPGPLS